MDIELLILLALIFTFASVIMSLIFSMVKTKIRADQAKAGGSLSQGELKVLVREAVEEANAPLEKRLVRIERRLNEDRSIQQDQGRLLRDAPPELLGALDEPDEAQVTGRSVRQRLA